MVLAFGLLVIGVLSRFLPHAANFSPVAAIALFGGVYLRRSQALWLPLALMAVSDLFLGLHATIPFTWGSMFLVSLIGLWVKTNATPLRMMSGALASAFLFFVVTNFGAWLTLYPRTMEGFVQCYTLAIPFFRMSLVSTLFYSVLLFGAYDLFARRFKGTKLETVLLRK
ncbi:MAG: DUF6580 family putative transport protein [Candidatus Omnitrophota bacterium]